MTARLALGARARAVRAGGAPGPAPVLWGAGCIPCAWSRWPGYREPQRRVVRLLLLLAIAAYVRYVRSPRAMRYLGVLTAVANCGMMAKPMLVT